MEPRGKGSCSSQHQASTHVKARPHCRGGVRASRLKESDGVDFLTAELPASEGSSAAAASSALAGDPPSPSVLRHTGDSPEDFCSPNPTPLRSHAKVWLIDDNEDIRRRAVEALMVEGCRFRIVQTCSLASQDQGARMQHELIQSGPALLWARVRGTPGNAVLDRTNRRRLDCLIALFNLQLCRRRHVFAEFPRNGAVADYLREQLSHDAYVEHLIPWCSLGVHHPQNDRPIGVKTAALTTLSLRVPTVANRTNSVTVVSVDIPSRTIG